MRALYFGTPEIAVPALRALHEVAQVVAVVCQPDRPAGRGMQLRPPAVKVAAQELGVAVHQPKSVKKPPFLAWMQEQQADVALVMAYGRILPQEVLAAPRRGCMNLHASLLPKYRGAAPINWAVAAGESETGVCLMQMDAGMDTGPVLSAHAIPIGEEETAGELAERIATLAANVVREDLARAVRGELNPREQDHDHATMAPMLQKSDGAIDWNQSAQRVHDHARGMTPWPGAFTHVRGKMLKVRRTRVRSGRFEQAPGTVVIADANAVVVACREGALELLEVQLEGRKPMNAGQMAVGRGLMHGDVLCQLSG